MGLFGKKKPQTHVATITIGKSSHKTITPSRPPLDLLMPNGELPYGWTYANRDFTQAMEAEWRHFVDSYLSTRNKDIKGEYAALKSLVLYADDLYKICDQKGVCFAKWASEIIVSESELKKHRERLQYLEENKDDLLKKEQQQKHLYEVVIPKLRTDLTRIIKDEPGVVQSEIYKRFPEDMKEYVSTTLYYMAKDGKITREKSGRTYKLFPR